MVQLANNWSSCYLHFMDDIRICWCWSSGLCTPKSLGRSFSFKNELASNLVEINWKTRCVMWNGVLLWSKYFGSLATYSTNLKKKITKFVVGQLLNLVKLGTVLISKFFCSGIIEVWKKPWRQQFTYVHAYIIYIVNLLKLVK